MQNEQTCEEVKEVNKIREQTRKKVRKKREKDEWLKSSLQCILTKLNQTEFK